MSLKKYILLLTMAVQFVAGEYLRKENNTTETTNKWYSGADGCNYGGGVSIGVAGGGV